MYITQEVSRVKTKLLLIALILVLTSVAVLAAEPVSVTLVEGNGQVIPGGSATFTFLVRNLRAETTTYSFEANPLDVYPFAETISHVSAEPGTFTLTPNEIREVTVTIDIHPASPPKHQYQTILYVKDVTSPELKSEVPILLNVAKPQQLVLFETNFPDEIIPSKQQQFDLTYEATANVLILNATIHVVSEFFEESFSTPIHFKTPQTRTLHFDLPSATEPGTYTVEVKAERDGAVIGTYKKTFTVGKNPDIQERVNRENTLLTRKITIVKENTGNLRVAEEIKLPLNKFQQIFTLTTPQPTKIENERTYVWNFELKPGEQGVVTILIDYRSLAVAVVLIILFAILLVYLYNKKIFVTKKIYRVTTEKDGISEVKIRITAVNKARDIDHVTLIDPVPRLMRATGEFGTLKPRAIQKTPLGHKLIWEFGHLRKGEERIITYTVQSKMHLVGTIRLPPAAVSYKKRNKHITHHSNSVVFTTRKPAQQPEKQQ